MPDDKNGRENIARRFPHASSNLPRLCSVILGFMRVSKTGVETIIDGQMPADPDL